MIALGFTRVSCRKWKQEKTKKRVHTSYSSCSITMQKPLYNDSPKILANVYLEISIEREPYGRIEIEVRGILVVCYMTLII